MKTRSLLWIFGSLAALLVAYGIVRVVGSGSGGKKTGHLTMAEWVDEATALIRVSGPGPEDSLRLERTGDGWRVNGYPADTAALQRMLTALGGVRQGELVARSPANHGRLGVAGPGSRVVEIGPPANPGVRFFLGGSGPGGRYVRLDGEDEVYLVEAAALDPLTRSLDTWRERSIAALDTATVRRVEIARGRARFFLSREDGGWQVGDAPADTARVRRMLEALADLRATGFPADSEVWAADFEAPDARIDVYADGGGQQATPPLLSLLFSAENEGGDYLVRRADRPFVVRLAGWSADRILGTRQDFTASE
ncbi:MAG: DUF4340 domain-containing protein [Gemmatimonadota bacterium]